MSSLPKSRVPLTPTADGLAYAATVVVDKTPYRVLIDTSSSVGLMLSCVSIAEKTNPGGNTTECLALKSKFDSCPADSTYVGIGGDAMCKQTTPQSMSLELGEFKLPAVPTTILTADTTKILHGTDGMLGLAWIHSDMKRTVNLTDQIQSFSTNLAATDPYLLINQDLPATEGWVSLRQLAMILNDTAIAVQGFSESVDKTFVAKKYTQAAKNASEYVKGWIDTAWPSIVFPATAFDSFHTKYLTDCTPQNVTYDFLVPKYYYCDAKATLPRLAFTTTNGTFFLDKEDYVETDPKDPSRAIVLVQNSSIYKFYSEDWGLGLPFVRKFPTYFNATGNRFRLTVHCKPGVSCDVDKWVVNGAKNVSDANLYYDTGVATPKPTYQPGIIPIYRGGGSHSSSTTTHTRYWAIPIAIPLFLGIVWWQGRRHYRQWKVDRARQRMRDERDEPTLPATSVATASAKPNDQPFEFGPNGMPATPTTAASYSLLGGPTTLTVNHNTPLTTTTTATTAPPTTGVAARLRNDLAELETRV